ncbi:succinylglutamate-semialdehyde dehydrogenase [Vibrio sp. DNF-1]|nr:succinylglutamate-semialdehyde dehydrogenase [Vibrio salinus]MCE0495856.1 succinylglutamate-semialdehyde dehydrogenase [Vibrio salinus]
MVTKSLFIDGHWTDGSGVSFEKRNPANNELLWTGYSASDAQVVDAIHAARNAFPSWAELTREQRLSYLKCFVEKVEESKTVLSEIISRETGKPLWESLTEVQSMINKLPVSVNSYNERTGLKVTDMGNDRAVLRHRPHGVLAVFGPYNFPGHLPNGHIIPALLAGNTVVFKPSELTPMTAEKIVELWAEAGLPNGVLNLIQGGKDVGISLSSSPEIDGLLFTGSANTGYQLHRQLGGQPEKILALEMGGNNALIAHSYHDLDAAVNIIIQSAFITSGQRCTCARRLLVPENIEGDKLLKRLCEVAGAVRVGEWDSEPVPFMGSVISGKAARDLLDAQKKLCVSGAARLLEMKLLRSDSALLSPGIIDVTGIESLPDDEYFGPLLSVIRYKQFEEAIEIANNTRFGLATGLISTDRKDYDTLLLRARAGIVNWNKPLTGASSSAPFGGTGASGNHRPSAYYAADYCSWPMASIESETLVFPENPLPGLHFK